MLIRTHSYFTGCDSRALKCQKRAVQISSFLENDTSRELYRHRQQHIADDRIMTVEIELSSISKIPLMQSITEMVNVNVLQRLGH